MKKMLVAICSCALTLSIAVTPASAANSNSCQNQGTCPQRSQFARTLNYNGCQNNSQTAGVNFNSLFSQFLNRNCADNSKTCNFPSKDWCKYFFGNNCLTNNNCNNNNLCDNSNCNSLNCNWNCNTGDDSNCDDSNCNSCDDSSCNSDPSSSEDSSNSESTPSKDPSSSDNSSSEAEDVNDSSYREFQKRVINLVNKERAANGLSALQEDSDLDKVATLKSEDMAKLNYFSHTSPTYGSPFDMLSQFGISYKAAGENIAMGQPTPESVMNAWMNSEGHRANILNSNYTHIGVGIAKNANGQYIWTQTFLKP